LSNEIKEAQEGISEIEDIYDTDYQIGQDNIEKWGFDMHAPVFPTSAGLILLFVVGSLMFPEESKLGLEATRNWIQEVFDWMFLSAGNFFVLFCLVLIVLPVGKIRLGGDDARPDFSVVSWFAMLFAAGMGTGLVFWGVAEPLNHYMEPHYAEPETAAAMRDAMRYSFFHWGLHPWAIYLVLALSIAYFHFRIGLPLAPRSVLWPLLGQRIYGPIGHAVDILCTVGTLLGVATSLGLGAMQINAGLARSLDLPTGTGVQIGIIVAITLVATISVVSGLQRGIRRLSSLNIAFAALLLAFVFLIGPTLSIIATFFESLGTYLVSLPAMSLEIGLGLPTEWETNWTLFYWGWWISWSPFVGIFVARISRGRTVREVILVGHVAEGHVQSRCAGANQGAFRREWQFPCQETQRRVAPAQWLPKGRRTSAVGGVALARTGSGQSFARAHCP